MPARGRSFSSSSRSFVQDDPQILVGEVTIGEVCTDMPSLAQSSERHRLTELTDLRRTAERVIKIPGECNNMHCTWNITAMLSFA